MTSVNELKQQLIDMWPSLQQMRPSTSEESDWGYVCMQMDNSNICTKNYWNRATAVKTRSIWKMLGPFALQAATCPNFTLPFTRCRYCRTPPVAHRLRIDVNDNDDNNNDNAWQRGPLWAHRMGPIIVGGWVVSFLRQCRFCICSLPFASCNLLPFSLAYIFLSYLLLLYLFLWE